MADQIVRPLTMDDASQVLALYQAVAATPLSGLARERDEITMDYVAGFLSRSTKSYTSHGAFKCDLLQGEIHATRIGPKQFAHVLTDLTIAVHPSAQGQGVGTKLFESMFAAAERLNPKITRIELIARSGNLGAIRLYKKLGFTQEGCFRGRVHLPNGIIEDDIPMARSIHKL